MAARNVRKGRDYQDRKEEEEEGEGREGGSR
jgi:hypothetical protein